MRRLIITLLAPLLLTGCFMSPGKFQSQLQLMKDGSFAYSYTGEIQFLALSKLAEMGAKNDAFAPQDCYDDELRERQCTADEIADQKREWQAGAEERMANKAREAEQMKLMLGGIDPSSPQAVAEFAAKLQRQRGWKAVTSKGDGVFQVDFAIAGLLNHDFVFPSVEGLPAGSSFVNLYLREDGKVRIEAPGFAAQGAGNPMQAMMGGMMGMANLEEKNKGKEMPDLVKAEGRFTIITDGAILTNNTDEGPQQAANGQLLVWNITPRTASAPEALIQFSR